MIRLSGLLGNSVSLKIAILSLGQVSLVQKIHEMRATKNIFFQIAFIEVTYVNIGFCSMQKTHVAIVLEMF